MAREVKRVLSIMLMLFITQEAIGAECDTGKQEVWHVLSKSHKGEVSLLRNLTQAQAREVMRRLDEIPPTRDCTGGCFRNIGDDYIVKLEAFGPKGCELKVWDESEYYWSRKKVK